jgi:hypothetical protein
VIGQRRRALVINAENGKDRWTALQDAALSGEPFAVTVADDLLALDFDHGHPATCRAFYDALVARGIRPVLVGSGPNPDRMHLFARVADPKQLAALKAEARAQRFDVRDVIRPPFAPHRTAGRSQLLEPRRLRKNKAGVACYVPDPVEALARLRRTRKRQRLTPRIWALLRDGDRTQRYVSRSHAMQAIVTPMVRFDWSFDTIKRLLLDPKNKGGRHLQERPAYDQARVLKLSIRNAREHIANEGDRPDFEATRAQLAECYAHAAVHPWPKQAGSMQRALLTVLYQVSESAGSLTFTMSERELSERAGMARMTVRKHTAALEAGGWIGRRRIGKHSGWTILRPFTSSPEAMGGRDMSGLNLDQGHDVFSHRCRFSRA